MYVYLLEFTGTDDEHVIGVFSTPDKAQKYADNSNYPSWELDISEWQVDAQ